MESEPTLCDVWSVKFEVRPQNGRVIRIRGSQESDVPPSERELLMLNYCGYGLLVCGSSSRCGHVPRFVALETMQS
jgi:hypothetical protein